jgi:hypothetical protein
VPVVPQSPLLPAVTVGTGPAACLYSVDAAFMSCQLHERGIHAVRPGAGEVSVAEVSFRSAPQPTARRERTTINLS